MARADGHGPEQVAGIHRVNGDIGKAFLQGLDLPVAVVGDETVILAVDAAVQVSLRLGVSNEVSVLSCLLLRFCKKLHC